MEQDGAKLSTKVYLTIRRMIRDGELQPHERLIETELSRTLGVSRTPVREALQFLLKDGLVAPNRNGWTVRAQTPEEIRAIYETIAVVEGGAARLAAVRATDEQLARIRASMHVASSQIGDRSQVVGTNDEFHDAIADACGNDYLREVIERNRAFYFNRHLAGLYSDDELFESRHQHLAIMEALERRDADAVEALVREHVALTIRTALPKLFPHRRDPEFRALLQ